MRDSLTHVSTPRAGHGYSHGGNDALADRMDDSRIVAKRLVPMRLPVCAAPAYAQQHGLPRRPDDLARHACVNHVPDDRGHYLCHLSRHYMPPSVRGFVDDMTQRIGALGLDERAPAAHTCAGLP